MELVFEGFRPCAAPGSRSGLNLGPRVFFVPVHPSGTVQIKRPKSDPEVLPGPPRWKYFHRAKPEADPEVLPGGKLFSVFHENVYPNKRIYSYHFGLFGGPGQILGPGMGRFEGPLSI